MSHRRDEGRPAKSAASFLLKSFRLYSAALGAATDLDLDATHRPGTPAIVLDTNVTLDWLLFADPDGLEVGRAILDGALCWVATPEMRKEHFDVLGRAMLQRWAPNADTHRRCWDAHCRLVEPLPASPGGVPLRCADPQDQMFVDFALNERPAWLLSRDKALLALAPALRPHGVAVLTPAAWRQAQQARGGVVG